MKKKRYLKANNLPPRISLAWPFVVWMLLDHFGAPGWLYGAVFALIALVYVVEIYRWGTGEEVDLLNPED